MNQPGEFGRFPVSSTHSVRLRRILTLSERRLTQTVFSREAWSTAGLEPEIIHSPVGSTIFPPCEYRS